MKIYHSDRIRAPEPAELALNLWIDRMGAKYHAEENRPDFFRCLNLYAAVTVIEGVGFYEGKTTGRLPLEPGDTMMIFPDEPSRYWGSGIWSTEWIVWNGSDMEKLVTEGYFTPTRPIIHQSTPTVLRCLNNLRQMVPGYGVELAKKVLLLGMLLELHRLAQNPQENRHSLEKKLHELELTGSRYLPVNEIARHCGMSAVHFRRRFKEAFGISPAQYFMQQRLNYSLELLSSGLAIKEVSAQSGFCNEFHFRRKFREHFGYPPGSYTKLGN